MRIWWAIGVVAVALIVVESGAHDIEHATFWWHRMPGFDLAYGFIGCVAIVLLSKALGKRWIQRPEAYYDKDRP